MDLATIIGIVLALAGIVGGLLIEGGNIKQILQPTAAMIVFGGTFGALLVSFPLDVFILAMKGFIKIVRPDPMKPEAIIEEIIKLATKARKDGVVSLEADAKNIQDPFFKKAIMMAVDGADPKELQKLLEMQLSYMEEDEAKIPKVWESAGGYSPTIGIIGAVMGLIQVMGHLEDIQEVGRGIAVAFVATIYGVAAANIVFLPASGKLALQNKKNMVIKEMILEGVMLIVEGVNPRVIQDKLSIFFGEKTEEAKPQAAATGEKAA
ncbi:MAG: flagellar motor protein [Deltaproteobacteria bacterium]|nr:flagellar motor protein [Deltaproteobacteria bacterium]